MIYWIWLNTIDGLGPVMQRKLLNHFKNPKNIFDADEYEIMKQHAEKLAQQQAEYDALMKQYEIDKTEQTNQNKYLESELNSYNGSNQDSTYKSTITEDARINAISKYLRELEMANQKK